MLMPYLMMGSPMEMGHNAILWPILIFSLAMTVSFPQPRTETLPVCMGVSAVATLSTSLILYATCSIIALLILLFRLDIQCYHQAIALANQSETNQSATINHQNLTADKG